ncbi:hypothetical protein M8J75_002895 [Diaphorina citri]|nr:hypothetical protein M8J75_002895 [Diaphorina citri]
MRAAQEVAMQLEYYALEEGFTVSSISRVNPILYYRYSVRLDIIGKSSTLTWRDAGRVRMFTLLSQNRALYCYILLTLWIFLMIAGMYRYVGTEENISSGIRQVPDIPTKTFSKDLKPNIKTKRVLRQCNLPEYMEADEEGRVEGSYSLESLTILLRHGDRGPMNHVRNISSIDCSSSDPLYSSYNSFWANISLRQSANPFLPFLSTFHNYPLVPPVRGGCELGQLTPLGASQLLHVGALLRSVYGTQLGLDNFTLGAQDIQLYSTPYRRTFQSLLAFLHEFLHPDELQKFTIKEVSSLAFCFHECACSAAYYYTKLFDAQKLKYLRSHPAVIKLVRKASQIVYELNSKHLSSDPHALRDALLSYVCHGASLPCHQSDCVKSEDVTGVFAYIEWETRQYSRMVNMRRSHLLKAYGLLKRLVSSLLSSVSDNKPRLSVYSGHDYTLRYLAVTLGLYTDATASPIYASRFIIELYKNKAPSTLYEDNASSSRQYYLRFLFNGKDLTNKISFCKRAGFRHSDTAFLCPIESVVRFLHDDYFTTFNTTNFKDACMRP